MKIGILTYHRSNNVGALLQNYALIHKLNELGHAAETIDYKCDYIEENNRLIVRRGIKETIKLLMQLFPFIKREMLFNHFRKVHIRLSSNSYNKKDIPKVLAYYDAFVTGSDQVWNLKLNGEDYTYLLDFVQSGKLCVSYAASFGYSKLPLQFQNQTIRELHKFSYVSVREESAKNILAEFGIKSQVVLDPTLLLTGNQWIQTFDIKKKIFTKYIFVYLVAYTPELLEAARKRAKEENLELWVMHYNYRPFPKCKNITSASPIDFLQYIYDAEYVYCSSFHAMCFSVLFKKEFFYALDKSKENNNSRLETLADSLDLRERNIENSSFRKIEYNHVENLLARSRKLSIEFLKSIQ